MPCLRASRLFCCRRMALRTGSSFLKLTTPGIYMYVDQKKSSASRNHHHTHGRRRVGMDGDGGHDFKVWRNVPPVFAGVVVVVIRATTLRYELDPSSLGGRLGRGGCGRGGRREHVRWELGLAHSA
ncbi:hypothetical protein H257_09917 [Aphanomyces astaci]|uniref:Uncharacterized protein n=1 Tax=Aphanomyces astaci TaxID=112090 RepID=W4GA60_APHAT|nr:hypothetical protein H257_09917 [Aphanomyces astaci]ETV75959.1 hypothetical protein H257_09917 [Aphanomyces astaci]|eukprot:XP_009834601.1 hypothetical protein H257_09917 [Aphanomyces astaci]